MTLPIFYAKAEQIDLDNNEIEIQDSDFVHLTRSLRVRAGDRFTVGDGRGRKYESELMETGRSKAFARIISVEESEREVPSIGLLQAVSRPSKMDEVIARAAETGIGEIRPFEAPRSTAGSRVAKANRFERWTRVAREASMVAGRAWALEVAGMHPWPLEESAMEGYQQRIVLWEGEKGMSIEAAVAGEAPDSICIVVGPEGGFSRSEIDLFRGMGGETVSMGDLIMRTETAGSYAAMIIRSHYGLLRPGGGQFSWVKRPTG